MRDTCARDFETARRFRNGGALRTAARWRPNYCTSDRRLAARFFSPITGADYRRLRNERVPCTSPVGSDPHPVTTPNDAVNVNKGGREVEFELKFIGGIARGPDARPRTAPSRPPRRPRAPGRVERRPLLASHHVGDDRARRQGRRVPRRQSRGDADAPRKILRRATLDRLGRRQDLGYRRGARGARRAQFLRRTIVQLRNSSVRNDSAHNSPPRPPPRSARGSRSR